MNANPLDNDGTNGRTSHARHGHRNARTALALSILLLSVPAFPPAARASDEAGRMAGRCSPKASRPVQSEILAAPSAEARPQRSFTCEPMVPVAQVTPARVPAPLRTSIVGARALSERGLQHLVECEGFSARPYADAGRCSVGYGHRVHDGPCSRSAHARCDRISEEEARAFLLADVARCERTVNELVLVPLDQGQFDALVSFVFNVGARAFRESRLLQVVNAGEFESVPDELRRWVYQGRTRVQGLANRREKEILLFTSESAGAG